MTYNSMKLLYLVSCICMALVILSPTLTIIVGSLEMPPLKEGFSELYLLGPGGLAYGYPFTVSKGTRYSVTFGVGNQMGSPQYYRVYAKLSNQTEPLPNVKTRTPSSLPPLLEYRLVLGDGRNREQTVTFSLEEVLFAIVENVSERFCRLTRFKIDDHILTFNKGFSWDPANRGFYCHLFFELWAYEAATSTFQFHNRFVGIWLNMTRA